MVQIGQASLHGAREAGNPQTVQVVMAPALARDVRPDQLGCHWTHVGGLVDLGGSEERLLYCTHTGYPTQTLNSPVGMIPQGLPHKQTWSCWNSVNGSTVEANGLCRGSFPGAVRGMAGIAL